MICNLQKYAKSSWFPVDFLSKCHIMMQDIFFLSKLKTSFFPNKINYRLWIQWKCFRHVKWFFGKNKKNGENKFTLLWIMLRCFWDRGGKRGFNVDSTLFVFLDKLLIWVIITIRLLWLRFDENRFMGIMKEHPENGHFSLFGSRDWTLFRSKIFFVMKMKMKKII